MTRHARTVITLAAAPVALAAILACGGTGTDEPEDVPAVTATTPATVQPESTPEPTTAGADPDPIEEDPAEPTDDEPDSVYYKNCTAARDARAAPVRRGDPGYGRHLDRDGDGIACE